jgi:hypothetical protein
VIDFDPEGDGEENHAAVSLAYDNDTSSAWETSKYRNSANFGGLKSGAGLLLDFGKPLTIRRVVLGLSKPGISLELRASNTRGEDAAAYPVVASAADVKTEALTLTPKGAVAARYWVIWIIKLVPIADDPGRFRGGIAEFAFLS